MPIEKTETWVEDTFLNDGPPKRKDTEFMFFCWNVRYFKTKRGRYITRSRFINTIRRPTLKEAKREARRWLHGPRVFLVKDQAAADKLAARISQRLRDA